MIKKIKKKIKNKQIFSIFSIFLISLAIFLTSVYFHEYGHKLALEQYGCEGEIRLWGEDHNTLASVKYSDNECKLKTGQWFIVLLNGFFYQLNYLIILNFGLAIASLWSSNFEIKTLLFISIGITLLTILIFPFSGDFYEILRLF